MIIQSFCGEVNSDMMVIVTYDIRTDTKAGQRRLNKAAKHCLNYGTRVQNSVYELVVDASDFQTFKYGLLDLIDSSQDSVSIYKLGNNYSNRIEKFGVISGVNVTQDLIY